MANRWFPAGLLDCKVLQAGPLEHVCIQEKSQVHH